jgi:hypothetical protein
MNKKHNEKKKSKKLDIKDRYGNSLSTPEMILEYNDRENDFYQALIEFYGVDTNGPTYEGRVYVNNPNADGKTPLDESSGYVGSYYVFGHDGCWGDEGHCHVLPNRTYDSRTHSHTDPVYKAVDATKAIKKCVKANTNIVVTVVPKVRGGQKMSNTKEVVRCERIRLTCYENPAKSKKST